MMTERDLLISQIDEFCAKHGLSDRQFSLQAVGYEKYVYRLRRGKTGHTLNSRAKAYLAAPAKLRKVVIPARGRAGAVCPTCGQPVEERKTG